MNIPWNSPCKKCGKDSEECEDYENCPKWRPWFDLWWHEFQKWLGECK